MEQHIPQEEIRRIIISDMVKKRNSIVPVIGEDTIVYSLGVPLILQWLFYRLLELICSVFKEVPKVTEIYAINERKFLDEPSVRMERIGIRKQVYLL